MIQCSKVVFHLSYLKPVSGLGFTVEIKCTKLLTNHCYGDKMSELGYKVGDRSCQILKKVLAHILHIIIIIIIINEKINVAYSPKTSRTRNKQKKENSDVFGRWKHRRSQRH